ncbi:MAG TPA: hypothetical protein VFO58_00130 [Vicinamibacterales bacterium]|nr:hypothetical protein [Vicinamibacterales bacterium]
MNHHLACLAAAGLALAVDSGADVSASVYQPAPIVEILVAGHPQRQYPHQGRWYVEALKGREYAIRLRNPYGVRVAVALSVDGLNTIDARQTTASGARKWVLEPHETVTISGWQTSQTEARRFEFTTEERSYGQALGKTANLGVISAVFFRERVPVLLSRDSARQQAAPAPPASGQERSASAVPPTADLAKRADEEYAATGMGRRTNHAVTQVWLDLEDVPAQSVNIRYEFHPQLVKLGILPPVSTRGPLDRRERARGFEPGFAPVPPSFR